MRNVQRVQLFLKSFPSNQLLNPDSSNSSSNRTIDPLAKLEHKKVVLIAFNSTKTHPSAYFLNNQCNPFRYVRYVYTRTLTRTRARTLTLYCSANMSATSVLPVSGCPMMEMRQGMRGNGRVRNGRGFFMKAFIASTDERT